MPMPRLPETHHRNMATKNAFQVKKKRAATAPTWKSAMAVAVPQLMPSTLACCLPRSASRFSVFMAGCSHGELHRINKTIAGEGGRHCNTCVIPVGATGYGRNLACALGAAKGKELGSALRVVRNS